MSEKKAEDLTFLLLGRAPGKRRVKLADANNIPVMLGGDDDDEEDEDFQLSKIDQSGDDQSSEEDEDGDSSEETGSSEGSEGSEDEEDESNTVTPQTNSREESNMSVDDAAAPVAASTVDTRKLLCSLCLNLRVLPDGTRVTENADVIQCDKCGLAVHECCYSNSEGTESVASGNSSASTEPWFCEPCIAGQDSTPPCELCPSRGGAMKRMDTNRWVHLLCALYNPKVCFDDYDLLSMVTITGMNYKEFGKSSCHACEDKILARTGVAVKCDAGMCKLTYHVTCAQRLGLLMDDSSKSETTNADGYGGQVAADPWYLVCPSHCNQSEMKEKRRLFSVMKKQSETNRVNFMDKVLSKREIDKMESKKWAFNTRFQNLKIAKSRPSMKSERAYRLVHSSPEFLLAMQRKSEMTGVSKQEFDREFRGRFTADMVGKVQMPPAFSADFPVYYQEREKLLLESQKKLRELRDGNAKLKVIQEKKQETCQKVMDKHKTAKDELEETHSSLKLLCSVLKALGHPSVVIPEGLDPPKSTQKEEASSTSPAAPLNSKNKSVSQKSSSRNECKKTQTNGNKRLSSKSTEGTPSVKLINTCNKCSKINDQHLLAFCETCEKHYHLKCLDPPLTKMPKKNATFSWECSFCFMQSDESEEEEEAIDLDAPRKLRGNAERREVIRVDPFAELNAASKKGKKRKAGSMSSPGNKKRARISDEAVKLSGASPPAKDEQKPSGKQRKSSDQKSKGEDVKAEPVFDICDAPIEGAVVDVETSRKHRMQYPLENLEKAVKAVLDGKLGVKRAAAQFKVPRSTIGRRVQRAKRESGESVNVSDPNLDQSGNEDSNEDEETASPPNKAKGKSPNKKANAEKSPKSPPAVPKNESSGVKKQAKSSKPKHLSIDEKLRKGIQEIIQEAANESISIAGKQEMNDSSDSGLGTPSVAEAETASETQKLGRRSSGSSTRSAKAATNTQSSYQEMKPWKKRLIANQNSPVPLPHKRGPGRPSKGDGLETSDSERPSDSPTPSNDGSSVKELKIDTAQEAGAESPVKSSPDSNNSRSADIGDGASSNGTSEHSDAALALHSYTRPKGSPNEAVNGALNGSLAGSSRSNSAQGQRPGNTAATNKQKVKAIVVEELNL